MGAAGAICHIRKPSEENKHYQLHVANVGDTEVVLCRRGEAVCLSKLFTVSGNKDEMRRICKSDGIITEVRETFTVLCLALIPVIDLK